MLRKRALFFLPYLLIANYLYAQPVGPQVRSFLPTNSGSITSSNDAVTLDVTGLSTVLITQVTRACSTGIITFEASQDGGVTWFTLDTYNCAGGALSPRYVDVTGYTNFRSRVSTGLNGAFALYQSGHINFRSSGGGVSSDVNLAKVGNTSVSGADVVDATNTAFRVNCVTGCGTSSFVDNSAFTASTTSISNTGAVFNDSLAAVTSGNAAAPRITAQRAFHINLRNNAGTEIGTATTPVQVSVANTGANATAIKTDGSAITQPVSGTLGATQSGTWTVQPGNTANTTAWKVDGSAVTQPVSGTVTTTPPANASTNITQISGSTLTIGQQLAAASIPVILPSATITTLTPPTSITANAGTNLNTSLLALESGGNLATVSGAVISQEATTSGVKGITAFGAVTTNSPTYTTAKSDALSLDTSGLLRVSLKDTPANTNKLLVTPDAHALTAGSALIGEVNPVATATTTDSALGCYVVSAASTNSTNCKGSAGNIYGFRFVNTTTTIYYLRLYNSSSAPTCSSATGFIESIPIPAAATASGVGGGIVAMQSPPIGYTTGIGFCLTGGSSSTDNTNAATGVLGAILYK